MTSSQQYKGLTTASKLHGGTEIVYDDKGFECKFCEQFDSSVKEKVEAHEAKCKRNPANVTSARRIQPKRAGAGASAGAGAGASASASASASAGARASY